MNKKEASALRHKLANELGLHVSAFYPSNLVNAGPNSKALAAARAAKLPVGKGGGKGKVLTQSIPLDMIPGDKPSTKKPATVKRPSSITQSVDVLAKLIVAVTKELIMQGM